MPSAAILAGGHARRFGGRDKSALLVGGRTILERQLEALSPLTSDILLIGGQSSYTGLPIRVLADRRPDRGPLAGLETALAEATEPVVIVVACDMPFVGTELLGHLAAHVQGQDAAVPRTGQGLHPLCAAYGRHCLAAVTRRLDKGHLAMKELLKELRVRVIDEGELSQFGNPRRLLANVNTPDEYARLAGPHGRHDK